MPSIHLIINLEVLTRPYRSMDARLASVTDVSGVVVSLLSVRTTIICFLCEITFPLIT